MRRRQKLDCAHSLVSMALPPTVRLPYTVHCKTLPMLAVFFAVYAPISLRMTPSAPKRVQTSRPRNCFSWCRQTLTKHQARALRSGPLARCWRRKCGARRSCFARATPDLALTELRHRRSGSFGSASSLTPRGLSPTSASGTTTASRVNSLCSPCSSWASRCIHSARPDSQQQGRPRPLWPARLLTKAARL